ncbi:MAG TPA: hypothetical protein HPP77_00860 [Candidatus Hydrogenedentes bacterium]|nr:hypothetical protein [Candidatus Hydrogenedentota bacterium]HIJ74478.1 hypothetical protein [Candidatus Hydrogenedentota bacterium]
MCNRKGLQPVVLGLITLLWVFTAFFSGLSESAVDYAVVGDADLSLIFGGVACGEKCDFGSCATAYPYFPGENCDYDAQEECIGTCDAYCDNDTQNWTGCRLSETSGECQSTNPLGENWCPEFFCTDGRDRMEPDDDECAETLWGCKCTWDCIYDGCV